jgi:hypothetical protein
VELEVWLPQAAGAAGGAAAAAAAGPAKLTYQHILAFVRSL